MGTIDIVRTMAIGCRLGNGWTRTEDNKLKKIIGSFAKFYSGEATLVSEKYVQRSNTIASNKTLRSHRSNEDHRTKCSRVLRNRRARLLTGRIIASKSGESVSMSTASVQRLNDKTKMNLQRQATWCLEIQIAPQTKMQEWFASDSFQRTQAPQIFANVYRRMRR